MALCEEKHRPSEPLFPSRSNIAFATYSRKRKREYYNENVISKALGQPVFDNRQAANTILLPAAQHIRQIKRKSRLVQMTIDLGGRQSSCCHECGMEYVPWDPADSKVHSKFHESFKNSLTVSATVKGKLRLVKSYNRQIERGKAAYKPGRRSELYEQQHDQLVEVCRRDEVCVKNLALRTLEIAEKDLGAAPLPADQLWKPLYITQRVRHDEQSFDNLVVDNHEKELGVKEKHERFKFYLYVHDGRVIGLCLAERISDAFKVIQISAHTEASSSVTRSEESTRATMGISRIWIAKAFRGHGIAAQLLDGACSSFLYGAQVDPNEVAFSQPTESGVKFARRWSGKEHGWLVYNDN